MDDPGRVNAPTRCVCFLEYEASHASGDQGHSTISDPAIPALLGDVGAFPIQSYGMAQARMSLLDSLIPARTALLVIDMQRDFLSPKGYAAQAGLDITPLVAAIAPIQKLLAVARPAGLLIVHIHEGHVPDLSDCAR